MSPASTCSCPLPDGYWGRSGWHFRYMRREDLAESMVSRFDSETMQSIPVNDEVINDLAETYRGKWVTAERCPHYWKAAAKEDLY